MLKILQTDSNNVKNAKRIHNWKMLNKSLPWASGDRFSADIDKSAREKLKSLRSQRKYLFPEPQRNILKYLNNKLSTYFTYVYIESTTQAICKSFCLVNLTIDPLRFANMLYILKNINIKFRGYTGFVFDPTLIEEGEIYSIYKGKAIVNSNLLTGYFAHTKGENKCWGFSRSLKELKRKTKKRIYNYILEKI